MPTEERRRRKSTISKLFQRSRKILFTSHACDSPPRLREIPWILFERCHNVSARVGALCILWCPDLLIVNKSLLVRKEPESTLNLSFLESESKMHARSSNDDIAIFCESVRAHSIPFYRWYSVSRCSLIRAITTFCEILNRAQNRYVEAKLFLIINHHIPYILTFIFHILVQERGKKQYCSHSQVFLIVNILS